MSLIVLASLHFISDDDNKRSDEVVTFFRNTDMPFEMVEILYKPGDAKTKYRTWLHRDKLDGYIYRLFAGLNLDAYPYEKVQFSTSMTVPIMYFVSDIADNNIPIVKNIIDDLYTVVRAELVVE